MVSCDLVVCTALASSYSRLNQSFYVKSICYVLTLEMCFTISNDTMLRTYEWGILNGKHDFYQAYEGPGHEWECSTSRSVIGSLRLNASGSELTASPCLKAFKVEFSACILNIISHLFVSRSIQLFVSSRRKNLIRKVYPNPIFESESIQVTWRPTIFSAI